ncbi:MAG: hypothetical protein ACYTF7_01125 [Planctomycetota bacterium]|jgi:hypothetical protein
MPRLRAIRLGVLDSLAEQLRFAPTKTIGKQLLRAQSLAMSVEGERTYPEGWIVQQITGFAHEHGGDALVLGEALRREASAFIERMSSQGGLGIADTPSGSMRIEDLASRWDVSRATIGRYRDRGLIAWRVRSETGNGVLVFPRECVEWFEGHNEVLLGSASSFSRMEDTQKEHLVRLGRRASRRFGWNVSTTASRLAARAGRAHESMRLLLLGHEESGFQARPALDGETRDTEMMPRHGARRLALRDRRRFLESLTLPRGQGEPSPPADDLLARLPSAWLATTTRRWLEGARADDPVDIGLEIEASLALRALLLRASMGRDSIRVTPPRATTLDQIETDLRCGALLVERLTHMHRRTIVSSIESRLGMSLEVLGPSDARRVHREAHLASCEALLAHDPTDTPRVAGVISLAVDRRVSILVRERRIHPPSVRSSVESGERATTSVTLDDWIAGATPWSEALMLAPALRARLGTLPPHLESVVLLRFGSRTGWAMTMARIASERGTTVMAIARQLGASMRRLRPQE